MTLRKTAPRKTQRWMLLVLAVGALLIVGSVASVLAAPGDVSLSAGFEGNDGNLAPGDVVQEGQDSPNFDWNSFKAIEWEGTTPTRQSHKTVSGWGLTALEDWQVTTSDSAFAGGTKQDKECPTVNTGKAPNKDDLKRVYVASTTGGDGHTYLALAWVRIPQNTTSPSAHVAFEFNQGDIACGTGSDSLVERTEGDMLVVYDFEGGSADLPAIKLSLWLTDNGSNTAAQCEVAKALPCWGNTRILTDLGYAEARVNTFGSVTDELTPPTAPATASVSESLGTNEFGEAIIDLTGAGVFEEGECSAFGLAYAVSRSSGNSAQAQMKDLVGPGQINLQNCGSVVIRKVTVPDPDPLNTDFAFTTTGGLDPDTFSLKNEENRDYGAEVPSGAYTVTETGEDNYVLTDIDCSASDTGNGSSISIGGNGGTDTTAFEDGDVTVSFNLVGQDSIDCTFTNTLQTGAIQITKTSSKDDSGLEGATFSIEDENDVAIDGSPFTTGSDGTVCVDGLLFGDYTVTETAAPDNYAIDDDTGQPVSVDNSATCADDPFGGAEISFSDTPLSEIEVIFRSLAGEGVTAASIVCEDATPAALDAVSGERRS